MIFKLTAIREDGILPMSSLEAIKGGVSTSTCLDNTCNIDYGKRCNTNTCERFYAECDINNCTIDQGDCTCLFIYLMPPKCPSFGECPVKTIVSPIG